MPLTIGSQQRFICIVILSRATEFTR